MERNSIHMIRRSSQGCRVRTAERPSSQRRPRRAQGYLRPRLYKYAPDVAAKLLEKNGFTRDANGKWLLPDGTPWRIRITDINDTGHHQFKNGNAAVQQWKKFGIDAEYIATDAYSTLQQVGDFEVGAVWPALEPWGAGADLYRSLNAFYSEYMAPIGDNNRAMLRDGPALRWMISSSA